MKLWYFLLFFFSLSLFLNLFLSFFLSFFLSSTSHINCSFLSSSLYSLTPIALAPKKQQPESSGTLNSIYKQLIYILHLVYLRLQVSDSHLKKQLIKWFTMSPRQKWHSNTPHLLLFLSLSFFSLSLSLTHTLSLSRSLSPSLSLSIYIYIYIYLSCP